MGLGLDIKMIDSFTFEFCFKVTCFEYYDRHSMDPLIAHFCYSAVAMIITKKSSPIINGLIETNTF